MKNWKLAALLNTPLGLVTVLGSLVLTVEFLIMEVTHDVLVPMIFPEVYWGFIDTVLLTIIVSPALYFLMFRKMHESEERFRQINASAQDAIVIINEQGMVTDWNLAAQKMFQYSREEAVGQQMHQLIAPPRLHADAARGFARFQETGAGPLIGKTTELPALRKDGSEFPIELSISASKLKSSWHAIGVMRDITERKQAENKLAKSEQHFRAVTESANDAIITGTGAGNITGWNAAAGRVFGYTEAEIIGQPLTVLMPERFRNPHSAGLARVVAGGVPHVIGKTVELAGLRKDGSEFPLEFSLAQWQADEGQFFTAIIRDITERKRIESDLGVNQVELEMQNEELRQAQIALEESRDQFVDLYEFSPVGYLTLNREEMIDKINLTATTLLGEERNKLLHHRFALCVAMEDRDRWHRHFLDVLQHDGQQRCELALRRSDDSVFHAQLDCLHVKAGGASSVRVAINDITERKLAEAKLAEQLDDLRRWHDATIGREMRVLDLKHEVNELLVQTGQPPRYPSAESDNQQEK